ncbi:hypothetical protein ACVBEH_06870 [Roseateles sp. GG27B]
MFHPRTLSLLIASTLIAAAPGAHAAITLIASGSLSGAMSDLSGLTGTLENGVSASLLGGMGSGLAWAGGNTFLALPDRGPNALAYNPLVDDTTSYIARFQTLTLDLSPNAAGAALPFSLTPTLKATTLLYSSTALNYGTGAAGTGSVTARRRHHPVHAGFRYADGQHGGQLLHWPLGQLCGRTVHQRRQRPPRPRGDPRFQRRQERLHRR